MYTIRKKFRFEASHRLTTVPEGHPCGNNHGHSYIVEVFLQSKELDEHGFVVDFGELKVFRQKYIDFPEGFDHSFLNDKVHFETTAENLARHLYEGCKALFPQTVKVRVHETETGYADYYQTVVEKEEVIQVKTAQELVSDYKRKSDFYLPEIRELIIETVPYWSDRVAGRFQEKGIMNYQEAKYLIETANISFRDTTSIEDNVLGQDDFIVIDGHEIPYSFRVAGNLAFTWNFVFRLSPNGGGKTEYHKLHDKNKMLYFYAWADEHRTEKLFTWDILDPIAMVDRGILEFAKKPGREVYDHNSSPGSKNYGGYILRTEMEPCILINKERLYYKQNSLF